MKAVSAIGVLLAVIGVGMALPVGSARAADEGFADTTLAGIYELAIDNDYSIAEARAQFRVGSEERRLARAGLLPRLQGGYTYSDADTESRGSFSAGGTLFPNTTDTDAETDEWNVSLSQPLFDLPAWFRFQQGVQLSKQAEASFSLAQQDLVLRVVTAYFEVLRAAANVKASRSQESALEAQLDQVRQRFEVGMVAITDVHEARARYDLAVAQRIADEGQFGISREQLSVLTGRGHGDLWILSESFPVVDPEPATGDAWVDFARDNNFDILVARLARDAAQRGARAAASEHLPKVDLALTYADSNTDVVQRNLVSGSRSAFPNDQDRTVVALNFTVPIYTGGFTSASRRQAAAVYDTRVAGYEGTLRAVTQETRALHIQVVSDVARSRARAQAVTSTRSALEAAEVGYNVGTRNVVDVLDAQREFFSAVRDYENSIIDYVQDLVRLKRLAGTLTPSDIYELNRWLEKPPDATLSGRSLPTADSAS
ncbi:MAG: TolC family outer membrane protein [Pseudomonadales bacterium]